MKHNLLKSVIISVILLLGANSVWAKTFYLKPSADWKGSSAKFAICYGYDNSSDQNFVEMKAITGTDWYSAEVPNTASSKNVYFMRVSNAWKVSDKWTNKWNGFGWFSYSDGSHYVTDGWDAGSKLNAGFEGGNNGIKYWKSGDANDTEWSFNGNIAQDKNLNEVTHLNLKQWFTQMYENKDFWNVKTVFKYSIHLTSSSPSSYQLSNYNWETKGNWSDGYCYPKIGNNNIDINLLQNLNGSGKYTMSFYYYDPDLNITSPTHKLNWTYNIVPNVNNLKVTANNRVSGSGTSNDPYIITCGQSMTLTVSGEKASTDANSSLNVSFGDNSAYSSTLTKTYSSIPAGKQSVKVYAKFYNSADDLSGTETNTTIYYQAQTFAVNVTSAGNGTVTPNGNTQVGANQVSVSATPNNGYKFKNWTTTGNVTIANANNASTTITATGAGSSVTANFEEDLSSNWKLIGDNQTNSPFGDNYTYSSGKAMTKKRGHSTESNVYITLDIKHLPASYYGFKVATSNSDNNKYGYGQGGGDYIEFSRSESNKQKEVYSGSQHELKFIPDALGEYEFRVNYPSSKYVYVTFPTAYAVTFGKGTGGSSVAATYNSTSFNSGTKVQSGKTVTFTQTASAGYTFKEWNTKSDGTGTKLSTNATYTRTVAATNTVYAIYTKNPDKTIYLEPTGHWNPAKAVFQAHVWQSSNIGNSRNIDMTGIGDPSYANNDGKSLYRYYKVEVPAEYDKIVFYREDPANKTTIWNLTGDLTIPTNNQTLYVITDNTTSPATGTWKAPNFIYTITLGYCDFGTYGIKYNGQSYFSKPNENVTIDVPAGAQIEILEGQPFSNAYTGDVIKAEPTKEDIGQTLTINGDITLDDNFKTKKLHVVYLGVPETLDNWQLGNNQTYYIWKYDSKGAITMTGADEGSYVFTKDGIKYYRFTIAAGCNSYRFERKNKDSFTGTTYACSEWLDFQIPLTDVNCFTLKDEKDDKNCYKGTWGVLPAQPGDYRLLYVEQVVEKSEKAGDEWKPVITRKKAHPSDIIRKGTARQIVSLHTYKDREYDARLGDGSTYKSSNNPEIILQKYLGNDQWEDVECQMVYGPLETLPTMANLPGRKNASPNSNIDDLQYQDGIEIIKQDVLNHSDKGNGVWNFVVTQDGDKASVQWNETRRYEGEYYIRTDNAEGGWDQYTLNDNYMTYSQYAKDHSGFSHYFCRWVDVAQDPRNVKFTIANDYGVAISDTLGVDTYTNQYEQIEHDANIRWSWNIVDNSLARAYIQGTWKKDGNEGERNRNLVVNYKSSSTAAAQEDLLDDSGDWIYQKDFDDVKVGSHLNSLTATYPVNSTKTQTFAENLDMLTGGESNETYTVRVLYDFKINKTLVALVPNDKDATISIDVLIERINQGDATQVQAPIAYTNNQRSGEGSTVYGVMSFDKSHLIDPNLSSQKKLTYWISFPFDVKLSEIFGFGEVGDYWMIKYYDGKDRAAKGLYDDNTFWKFITNRNYTLKANQGYVLALNKKVMDANSPIFTNTTRISLYFPSKEKLLNINTDYTQTTCTIPEYTCTITSPTDRRTKDSNWNFIGVPSFANKNRNTTNENLKYFYDYDYDTDTYSVAQNGGEKTFKSMFAYMVQFAGIIDWSTLASNGSQGLAAKKTDNVEKHVLRIELQQNNTKVDQTYIQLEDEEVTAMFDMNYDLTKLFNSKTNIYSLIPSDTDPIQVAANVMPIEETIIPLGIKLDAAGEYTFAMPDGTDGIVVELIDYTTNTTTNLLLDDYTVTLPKGTNDARFALHVKPNKTTTSLEDVNTNTTGVKKYLIDGVLYMQKDGVLYDAQGKLVR